MLDSLSPSPAAVNIQLQPFTISNHNYITYLLIKCSSALKAYSQPMMPGKQPHLRKDKPHPPFLGLPLYFHSLVSIFLPSPAFSYPSLPLSAKSRQVQLGGLRSAVSHGGARPQKHLSVFELKKCVWPQVFWFLWWESKLSI